MPKVSIGLPVYNGENYVAQAISALLAQSFQDMEIIISDNASTDNTKVICQEFAAKDNRIKYVRLSENIGAAPNFNKCVELSNGEYFKWAAHDDICRPEYIEKCVNILDENQDVNMCHTGTEIIGSDNQIISEYTLEDNAFSSDDPIERFANAIDKSHACITVFGLMRRDVLVDTPMIASFIGSDRNLIAEFALRGRILHAPERLFLSRDHGERSVRAVKLKDRGSWFDSKRPYSGNFFYLRNLSEHTRLLFRMRMTIANRLRGLGKILGWIWVTKRVLAWEIIGFGRIKT